MCDLRAIIIFLYLLNCNVSKSLKLDIHLLIIALARVYLCQGPEKRDQFTSDNAKDQFCDKSSL